MDLHSNLEYLCRVCAANTKSKNSVAECVYILKTDGLKDKLDKFLYLKVAENDTLPKVLCKSCFRQVEATASLSKIAKHTQQVFQDFLLSNLPKGPFTRTSSSEFTSSDFMGTPNTYEKSKKDETAVSPAQSNSFAEPPPPPPLLPPLLKPLTASSSKGEVVVNVSVSDPLTRDNQQKMICNSQRRQSLLLESRFTPKSIAQKQIPTGNATPRPIAPKLGQPIETKNIMNNPKVTAPMINFYPVKSQQPIKKPPPQATQITTFSSGGYVIGRVNATPNAKEESKKFAVPMKPAADNILQQKRKNLVKALNNIKANSSGQMSLLKSSQQKLNITKTPLEEVVNQAVEDELPEKIIIAAPKNKFMTEKLKKEPLNLSSKIPASIAQLPSTAAIAAVIQQQQEQSNSLAATAPKPAFPEDILLGRVIRDMDLLKLILKALKWPVNKQNMELQLQRLKNSKFTDIMSDTNLLQDTDLTQLLGPYLAPVLMAAQALQQQQQQLINNYTLNNQNVSASLPTQPKMTALEAAQAEINKSIPYKLPPETSVQLVPATPEETEANQSLSLPAVSTSTPASVTLKKEKQKEPKTSAVPQKRKRRIAAQKARDSIVISDEEDASTEGEEPKKARQRSAKSFSNIQFELNPNFISQFNLLNSSGGNEADELMTLLLKQKAALAKDKKVQRRRRNSVSNLITLPPSEFDALIDLDDDIVLMEPVSTTSSEASTYNQDQQQQKTDASVNFAIPSVPLITRPIIKRRKTVIHSPKNRFDVSIELKNKEPTPPTFSSSLLRTKEKLIEETINQVATGNITTADNTVDKNPPKPAIAEKPVVCPAELPSTKPPQQKKTQNKSSLGQQLLEAIGLQKLPSKSVSSPQGEAPSSSTMPNSVTVLANSKQSVQKIRSALKKSLKQAQEQQLQKQKELSSSVTNTIIQDADSTTKSAIKEILVVQGKGSKTDSCSSVVDVEDQIDKVTLMVRNNDEKSSSQSTSTAVSEKEKKKDLKKSLTSKTEDSRLSLKESGTDGIADRDTTDKDQSNEEPQTEETGYGNQKLQKEYNTSPSSAAVKSKSNEVNTAVSEEIVTPKRRGRKRLVDKQIELEAAEAIEKEKDVKSIVAVAEGSRTFDRSAEEESENTSHNKNEEETESNKTSGRPTRQSKTQSKYYKGPDKPTQGRRSLPSRTTRNRKYC